MVHRAVAAWQKWLLSEQALRTTLPLSSWNVAVIGLYGSVGGCGGWDEGWWFDIYILTLWCRRCVLITSNYFVEFMLIYGWCLRFGGNILPTFANSHRYLFCHYGYSQDSPPKSTTWTWPRSFFVSLFSVTVIWFISKDNKYICTDMFTAIRVSKYISQYMHPFETSATHLQTIPWMKLHLPSLGYQHLLATLRSRWFFGPKK